MTTRKSHEICEKVPSKSVLVPNFCQGYFLENRIALVLTLVTKATWCGKVQLQRAFSPIPLGTRLRW